MATLSSQNKIIKVIGIMTVLRSALLRTSMARHGGISNRNSLNVVCAFSSSISSSSSGRSLLLSNQRRGVVPPSSSLYPTGNYFGERQSMAFFATTSSSSSSETNESEEGEDAPKEKTKKKKNTKGKPKSKKIKINPNWESEFDVKALEEAFDKMAKADGFDESTIIRAEVDDDDDDDFIEDLDADLDFDVDNFDPNDFDDDDEDEDDFIDFGEAPSESMASRIAAAKKDMASSSISVPDSLDSFAQGASQEDLRKLGFRREVNPYGDDETPRRADYAIIENAMSCTACGSPFQKSNPIKPGYLPPDKFDVQVKLSKIEKAQKLQNKADQSSQDWSPEDEIEWMLKNSDDSGFVSPQAAAEGIDINRMAEELDLDLDFIGQKKVICKRCHGLQNFGEVEEELRPGWTEEPQLSQDQFRELLEPIRKKDAVIIALVDIFDFAGSVLPELDSIAGDNPVLLAANKADLFPSDMGQHRAENWVRRELEYLGITCLANVGGAVRLVSCKTGFGINSMLEKARNIADDMDCDIYLVGSANAGKSTLVNRIMEAQNKGHAFGSSDKEQAKGKRRKKRAGNSNQNKGAITTSPLPGTTLQFIKVDIGDGKSLYDTPGLLVPGSLTQRLTPAELKMVVPTSKVEPVTFRVSTGKCVLVGGLAKIEVIGEETKPFLFTFFVANSIKLHPTDSSRAEEFIAKHAGDMLTPPLSPGKERMEQIGEFESHEIDIEGAGWKEAAADVTLRGMGWVSVTGAGVARIRVSVPKGIGVSVRPPLMPYDVWEATAKYTGGRAVRKSGKTKQGKRRKGVGRR